MAYFNTKERKYQPLPIPDTPPYVPTDVPTPEEPSTPYIPRPSQTNDTTLTLYKMTDDVNKIGKSLNNGIEFNFTFKENTDILNPIIRLESGNDISNYNYCFINQTNRYYFIDDIRYIRGHLYEISLHVDVLQTYADDIKNLTGVIRRQENTYNLYLPDSEFKTYANTDKKTIKFSKTPFIKNANFLLTVSGGH